MNNKINKIKLAAEQLKDIPSIDNMDPTKDTDPNRVLASAYDQMDEVVIAGTDKKGEFYFRSSIANGGTILWLIEHLKLQLMGITSNMHEMEEEDY